MADEQGIPWVYRSPTTFYINGEMQQLEQIEGALLNLQIGQGIVWNDGKRYRVVDSWFVFERHAAMSIGLHVFLEEVIDSDDDRPLQMHPSYYG